MSTVLLGTRKGLFTLEKTSSGAWGVTRHSHHGVPVQYAVADPRSGRWWASLDHGHWGAKLERSDDRGETWTKVAAPRYPDGAEIKEGKPATLRVIWTIEPGSEDQPGRLWLGTCPGALFVSNDDGESFEIVEGLWDHPSRMEHWFGGGMDDPAIHSVCIDPRDSNRALVGISCAGVFETTDDGATWHPKNKGLDADFLPDASVDVGHDPHLVALAPSNPDVVWQQNHCGVFVSHDNCGSWNNVGGLDGLVHFGFAVAVDEKSADTAWVIPAISDEVRMARGAALCVCRTEDGGKSWTALRRGLPQTDCYDIVYRHALAVSGDTLVFGSTTGNVYVSEDRGDRWQCVGNHFPMVYSARFVA